jgi:hypothetical protein
LTVCEPPSNHSSPCLNQGYAGQHVDQASPPGSAWNSPRQVWSSLVFFLLLLIVFSFCFSLFFHFSFQLFSFLFHFFDLFSLCLMLLVSSSHVHLIVSKGGCWSCVCFPIFHSHVSVCDIYACSHLGQQCYVEGFPHPSIYHCLDLGESLFSHSLCSFSVFVLLSFVAMN